MAGNAYKYQFLADEAINKLYQKGFISDDNQGFLQTLINDKLEIDSNAFFWQEHFMVEGNEYDIDLADTKKNPAWTVRQIEKPIIPMADAMAPLSEVAQLDNEGWIEKTGSMYQYGKGLYQNSLNKLELEARLRSLNVSDQNLINGFVVGLADVVKSLNYRVSNMAAQTLSKGGAYSNATNRGMSGVIAAQSAYIPTANFVKAGTKVWSNAECDIPSQMQKIEMDFKESKGLPEDYPMEWNLPYDMVVSVLLNNKYFKAEVNRYIRLYAPDKVIVVTSGASSIDTSIISIEQLIEYSRSSVSKIAPIRVVKESQKVQGITTSSTVKGWETGKAVLRPLGYAGVLVHAKLAEVELANRGEINNNIDYNIAKVQGFLYVINKVAPNGLMKAYHTDVLGRFATVLNESEYHVVVDTTQAD